MSCIKAFSDSGILSSSFDFRSRFFQNLFSGSFKLNFAKELCFLDVFRKQVMFDGDLFEAKRARVGCLHLHYSLETFSA